MTIDLTGPMAAGFGDARRAAREGEAKTGDPTAADLALKAKRHRGRKTESRDPGAKKVIESNELKRYVDRVVSLSREKAEVQDSIKVVYAEIKEAGYDPKAIRIVVKRALEEDDARIAREATELTADQMMATLGMLADLPLGRAAVKEKFGEVGADQDAMEPAEA